MIKSLRLGLFLLLFGAMAGITLHAQTSGTGSIEGTITDPDGAVVGNATVTATNTSTGVKTTSTSSNSGHYVLSLLKPGTYTVTVSAQSFSTLTQEHVVVDALADVAVSPKLALGTAAQTVTVTDAPPMLATEDVKLGSTMDNEVYDSLPLAMNQSARDPTAFVALAVGVNSATTQAAGPSLGSFNGGQQYQNEVYTEGLPLTSVGTSGDTRNLAFGVSAEAVDQFQVATTGSEAMFEGQGVENYVIKSGTNKFHGGVYEYFRNTIFDAKQFFATSTAPDHQNEFGVRLGGPIVKDKLFFFANYDGYRYVSVVSGFPSFQTMPTTAEQGGDFSAFPFPIYDPTTCLSTNALGVCTQRQQFSYLGKLNVLPPSRISSISKSFQSYLPTPDNNAITNNYLATPPFQVNNDSGTIKVDYAVSQKNHLFGFFSKGRYANPTTGSLAAGTSALPIPYLDGRSVIENSIMTQVHDAHSFTANVVNDFAFGVSRLYIPLTSNTANGNYPSKAGLTGLPPGIASTGFPDITFGGTNAPVSWGGTNSHATVEAQNTFVAQNNVLWTKGRNRATFGFQWQALQDNFNNPLSGSLAGFSFSQNETANLTLPTPGMPNTGGAIVPNTGLGYASYLLGGVDSSAVTQNAVAETGGRYKAYAGYVQDNIQLSPKLTMTAGLRWDVWTPFTEVHNVQSFFNPLGVNPVAGGRLGSLEFAGHGPDSCGCNTPVNVRWHNFGPRLGLAYQATPKLVLRASYGMFYAHAGGVGGRTNGRQGLSQLGFNSSGSLSSVVTGQPAFNWNSGFPGNPLSPPFINPSYGIGFILASAPGAAAIGAGPSTAQTITYGDPDKGGMPPQYQNFTFNIQEAVTKNMTLSVSYSGSVGRYLPGAAVSGPLTNQIPLQYLSLGSLLTSTMTPATVAQAAAQGVIVANPFPNFTGTIGQALKPYPQYSGISNPWTDVGKSSYNSLQATLNQRMSHGLTFMLNYTFSKEMDDLAGARLPGSNYLEYSLGSVDHAHVVQATFVYKLPFGEGHSLGGGNSFTKALIGNWQFSGIFTMSTGAPLSVSSSSCTSGGILGSCYPNYVPGFTGSPWALAATPTTAAVARTTAYLNKNAFASLTKAYTYGDIARSAPLGLFAPKIQDLDLSVRKEFPIKDAIRLSLQADSFNISNSVYFSAPNTSLESTSYGTITSQANSPRKWQFSGRVSF